MFVVKGCIADLPVHFENLNAPRVLANFNVKQKTHHTYDMIDFSDRLVHCSCINMKWK